MAALETQKEKERLAVEKGVKLEDGQQLKNVNSAVNIDD